MFKSDFDFWSYFKNMFIVIIYFLVLVGTRINGFNESFKRFPPGTKFGDIVMGGIFRKRSFYISKYRLSPKTYPHCLYISKQLLFGNITLVNQIQTSPF